MKFKLKNNYKKFDSVTPVKNYKNPQDYKVFNMGNEPTPVKKKTKTMAYQKENKKDTY